MGTIAPGILVRLGIVIALAAPVLGMPGPALAHAVLVKSEPGQRSTLHAAPSAVRLWFGERLEPAFSSIVVLSAGGDRVTPAAATLSASNGKLLELPLPALGPGEYTVRYQVLSVDGHKVQGAFSFRVRTGGPQQ